MSYYEAAKKVEKQKNMETQLDEIKKAIALLEQMIRGGETR
jgi:hypothetical protein